MQLWWFNSIDVYFTSFELYGCRLQNKAVHARVCVENNGFSSHQSGIGAAEKRRDYTQSAVSLVWHFDCCHRSRVVTPVCIFWELIRCMLRGAGWWKPASANIDAAHPIKSVNRPLIETIETRTFEEIVCALSGWWFRRRCKSRARVSPGSTRATRPCVN